MKIAVIRIRGLVNVNKKIEDTMRMLRLKQKHVCVIVDDKKEIMGMVKKIENFVAFGQIDKETLKQLIEKRGSAKVSEDKINDFYNGKIKIKDLGIKPFFRLAPPRGGFKKNMKMLYPEGILGNHGKDINKLIKKML